MLGMHRSGTSALIGALGLCGAWVGEASELTESNAANYRSLRVRRELRGICNRPLLAAADWWKVARFEPEAIPHAVLEEERAKFTKIVSALDGRGTWTLEGPRLCLVLPANCDLVAHNSLDDVGSLKLRNGFGASADIALWETYNRRTLDVSENLPRIMASHEALMSRLTETLAELIERLAEFGATDLVIPSEDRLGQLIEPSLHCPGASAEELPNLLSPSQLAIWQSYRSGKIFYPKHSASVSRATRQQLFDLESAQHSLQCHSDRTRELSGALATGNRTIAELRRRAAALTVELDERQATARAQEATIAAHEATIAELRSQAAALTAEVNERRATTKGLEAAIETRDATIRARDDTIRELLNSTSWKVTHPLRVVSRTSRRSLRTLRRALRVVRRSYTSRTAHVVQSVRSVLAPPRAQAASSKPPAPIETPSAVSRLIRESRQRHSQGAPIDPETLKDKKRLKVSVIA